MDASEKEKRLLIQGNIDRFGEKIPIVSDKTTIKHNRLYKSLEVQLLRRNKQRIRKIIY